MAVTDAFVRVYCDTPRCDYEEEVELTALAGRGWDDRHMKRQLERCGWRIAGGAFTCPDCVAQENDVES